MEESEDKQEEAPLQDEERKQRPPEASPAPAVDPASFQPGTLHGSTPSAYWSGPAPPTDGKRKGRHRHRRDRRRRRKYHHSSAGIEAQPPKNGWLCRKCLIENSNDDPTAVPGLCPMCSNAHQSGRVRAAAIQGRARSLRQQNPVQLDSEPEASDGYWSAASDDSAYDVRDERRILRWKLQEQGKANI